MDSIGGAFPREILYQSRVNDRIEPKLAVFVGLFNSDGFLDDFLPGLEGQEWTPELELVVADNASSDLGLERLLSCVKRLSINVVVVRNSQNIGALGSLYANEDLISSNWITFMHQDDEYSRGYLRHCLDAIESHNDSFVSTISFDYKTREGSGKAFHVPNPTWLASGGPAYLAFLESLANHAIPWPCTVFRRDYLLGNKVPFHSSAFLDTEIALKNVHLGSNIYLPDIVMTYRVHAQSGSHGLVSQEAEVLRFTSLTRVFQHSSFATLVETVPQKSRESWGRSVCEAACRYIESEQLKSVLTTLILESIAQAHSFLDHSSNQLLSTHLQSFGAERPAKLLSDLLGAVPHPDPKSNVNRNPITPQDKEGKRRWAERARGSLFRVVPKWALRAAFKVLPKRFIPAPWNHYKKT